jgi:hypothetical protein
VETMSRGSWVWYVRQSTFKACVDYIDPNFGHDGDL